MSLLLEGEEKYEETKKIHMQDRFLFLEFTCPGRDYPEIDKLSSSPAPRANKTHLTYRFVRRWIEEDKVKTILTTRNPKDTLVSLFHHYQHVSCEWNILSNVWIFFFHFTNSAVLNQLEAFSKSKLLKVMYFQVFIDLLHKDC